jgi:hypothetical protein
MRIHQMMMVVLVAAMGCGTNAVTGEPLISGSVAGSYDGATYTIKYGLVAPHNTSFLIALGSEPINCSTLTANDPPAGDTGVMSLPALDVKAYGSVGVQLFHNINAFTGVGSNTGSVTITSSSSASIAGTISYSDTISMKMYSLNGTFEVVRCP